MRVIGFGDSFTWGSELSDDVDGSKPSEFSWSALVAKRLGAEYVCRAIPGGSNSSITRRISSFDFQPDDIALVMWTWPSRFEIQLIEDLNRVARLSQRGTKIVEDGWSTICPFLLMTPEEAAKLDAVDGRSNKYKFSEKTGLTKIAEITYRIASDENFNYRTSLEMFSATALLDRKKIKHTFGTTTNLNSSPIANSQFSPYIKDKFFSVTGMHDWTLKKKYQISKKSHPHDLAHKDWVDENYEKIIRSLNN